jgi:hypothetical protein
MASEPSPAEYLVISRGQWDRDASTETIQATIDEFYKWIERMVDEGKMRHGQRLATGGKVLSKKNGITDGPFGESKEVIGGYWFVLANSLDEAAEYLSGNPCLDCGLEFELRPVETIRASAFAVTNETPGR